MAVIPLFTKIFNLFVCVGTGNNRTNGNENYINQLVTFVVVSWILDVFKKGFYRIFSHWQLLIFIANIYQKSSEKSSANILFNFNGLGLCDFTLGKPGYPGIGRVEGQSGVNEYGVRTESHAHFRFP